MYFVCLIRSLDRLALGGDSALKIPITMQALGCIEAKYMNKSISVLQRSTSIE